MRRNLTDTTMEVLVVSRPMTSPTDLHEVCQDEPGCCQLSHARAAAMWHPSDKKKRYPWLCGLYRHGITLIRPLKGPRFSGQGQKGPPMKKGFYTNETGERRTSSCSRTQYTCAQLRRQQGSDWQFWPPSPVSAPEPHSIRAGETRRRWRTEYG